MQVDGFAMSETLVGRAVSLTYVSGHTLEQHWQSAERIKWKTTFGPLEGYEQTESYIAFESWTGLAADGGSEHVLDQAMMVEIICDLN
jgi:hypothetical protein